MYLWKCVCGAVSFELSCSGIFLMLAHSADVALLLCSYSHTQICIEFQLSSMFGIICMMLFAICALDCVGTLCFFMLWLICLFTIYRRNFPSVILCPLPQTKPETTAPSNTPMQYYLPLPSTACQPTANKETASEPIQMFFSLCMRLHFLHNVPMHVHQNQLNN